MFDDEVDTGRYLFHYTSLEAFLGHILPSGRLRMSPFAEVNDPRESKDWTCSLSDDAGVMNAWDHERFFALQTQFTTAMKASAKVLCLTGDIPGLDPNRLDYTYGRGYAHPRMWDRYAGHHAGVCLAFDIDTLGDDVARSVAGRGTLHHMGVSYLPNPHGDLEAFNLRSSTIEEFGIDEALPHRLSNRLLSRVCIQFASRPPTPCCDRITSPTSLPEWRYGGSSGTTTTSSTSRSMR